MSRKISSSAMHWVIYRTTSGSWLWSWFFVHRTTVRLKIASLSWWACWTLRFLGSGILRPKPKLQCFSYSRSLRIYSRRSGNDLSSTWDNCFKLFYLLTSIICKNWEQRSQYSRDTLQPFLSSSFSKGLRPLRSSLNCKFIFRIPLIEFAFWSKSSKWAVRDIRVAICGLGLFEKVESPSASAACPGCKIWIEKFSFLSNSISLLLCPPKSFIWSRNKG